jgi:sulfide:quinone oxidoreductase
VSVDGLTSEPLEVLIAGGGVAGLESALALRDLAGDRVSLRLLAPNREFVYRPMVVQEPFGLAKARRYPLREIAADVGAELIEDGINRVDASARAAITSSGAELRYDALILGLGAQIRARYEHATTIDDSQLDELLHGLLQDVEGGYTKRLAFVVPPRMAWPLPLYELALMTSVRAYDANTEVAITIVTPEDAPLAIFGTGASDAVAALLADREIEVLTSAYSEVHRGGVVEISPGNRSRNFDRVVALPELEGPAVPGLPEVPDGFIPVDQHCQVRGLERVYAAGDATDFQLKYGGVAAQQADAAAHAIAALAGAPVEPQPFNAEVRGILLTGGKPRYLHAHLTGGHGFTSELTEEPSWERPGKIAAKYLAPYLDQRDRAARDA